MSTPSSENGQGLPGPTTGAGPSAPSDAPTGAQAIPPTADAIAVIPGCPVAQAFMDGSPHPGTPDRPDPYPAPAPEHGPEHGSYEHRLRSVADLPTSPVRRTIHRATGGRGNVRVRAD
ncbi:hypothetical protein ACFOVU_10095 [Nocardiopsis sediminis]|uniref:Uncharacterized protein n=1 Tax=Nocardiopsis sediminis TaxID=1778267 RepID=A0ABV8FMZ1_9ACTN